MRIISKFHDYYDTAMKFSEGDGKDGPMYIRNEVDCPTEVSKIFLGDEFDSPKPIYRVTGRAYSGTIAPFSIVFCGKLTHGVKISLTGGNGPMDYESVERCCYSIAEAEEFLGQYGMRFDTRSDSEKKPKMREMHPRRHRCIHHLEDPVNQELFMSTCIKHKLPIVGINMSPGEQREHVTLNPMLKQLEFFKILPPFQAYQELSMFIGGVLPQSSAMPINIADKDRIAQHGFDKWSFRKMPESGAKGKP